MGSMIAVVALLLLILPCFKVRNIDVVGNTHTGTDEILAAAGVELGADMLGVDWQSVVANIERSCPVRVTLKLRLAGVKIEVTELEQMYFAYADRWFSIDRDLTVLAFSEREEDFGGLMQVKLPAISHLTLGESVAFADTATDRTYISTVLEMLDERMLSDRVSFLDVSEKYHVSYVLDGSLQIVLGKVSELDVKLELAEEILKTKNGIDAYAVVDVSDVKRSTYRPMAESDFLLAY